MRYVLLLCSLVVCFHKISNFPHHNDDTEIVMVEEIMRYTDGGQQNLTSTAALITLHDEQQPVEQAYNSNADDDNESLMDTADDLIFLAKRPKTTAQKQHRPDETTYHQIDLLTSDEEDTLTSASAEQQQHDDDAVDGVPREIELRTDDHAQQSNGHDIMHLPPIDMSDFVALIPAAEVKSIAANYYRNDAEVQRAYAFLSGHEFAALKQHIIAIPEMSAFLRYLNNSGLDVVRFLYTLTNLTSKPVAAQVAAEKQQQPQSLASSGSGDVVSGNEIEKIQYTTTTATTIATATKIAQATLESTTTKEQLNGLHGLVDSILDILPQDQILATFFDKLETNEQFSKLVDNIGSPVFAKILNNMENSVLLRNLIFSLHNNGIYITRIVDSLKAYFFLGTF